MQEIRCVPERSVSRRSLTDPSFSFLWLAFGTLIVFGEDNKNEIHGYFIIRGQEIPEILKDVPDYESYNFTKVDSDDPAVRKNWEDFIAWDGELEGRVFADGEFSKRRRTPRRNEVANFFFLPLGSQAKSSSRRIVVA